MKSNKIVFIFIIILISSCVNNIKLDNLEKEDKFTLPIGNLDNELDFFAREDIPFSLQSDLFMSNGIFFISNGNGKKIMKFNSYGDMLQKISPARQSDSIPHNDSSWSFNKPGSLTITGEFIYIVDTLEYETALSDNYIDKTRDLTPGKTEKDKHILNDKVISIFDNKGNYINYIGQDGIGGKPFPFINNIYNDHKNRLIVITQTTFYWSIYRFNETGELLDINNIKLDYLPQLENEDETITQINNIIPDREKNRVLVELTFYKKIFDNNTGAIISMESIKSRVYYYDLINKNYISWMDLPNILKTDKEISKHYVLLDIVRGKYLFFLSQGLDGESEFLTITNENGYLIGEYDLQIENRNIIYSSFYVSYPEGILTGLLCTDYAGGVSLWRTDKIMNEDDK